MLELSYQFQTFRDYFFSRLSTSTLWMLSSLFISIFLRDALCLLKWQFLYTYNQRILLTRVRGTTYSAFARHGKDIGSRLGRGTVAELVQTQLTSNPQPNRVIAKVVKICTYCCFVGENALAPKQSKLPCTVRTFRQRSCNQRVGCLLLYVVV